ncbi:hypothetical protein B0T18DRAFT_385079 [Schizothecium vesticola]|uniref:Extracellular membrane protein CFEM domain-containing protein n=1 Tax=Schizothecium vesticola TaxID=314040 RepID=A0AA40F8A9_9PEZI|nr:hypothetical protein B0T18DRAFT_385079 [Schizothecium vesticola]
MARWPHFLVFAFGLTTAFPAAILAPRQGGFSPVIGTAYICNCNNPRTKETTVEGLCAKARGSPKYGYFCRLESVQQHMCVVDTLLAPEMVFTNAACQELYGEEYNAFSCSLAHKRLMAPLGMV